MKLNSVKNGRIDRVKSNAHIYILLIVWLAKHKASNCATLHTKTAHRGNDLSP